jgi:hypothetical protein
MVNMSSTGGKTFSTPQQGIDNAIAVWRIPRINLSGWRINAWKGMDPSKEQLNI